ncbi:response regulator [Motilimonas cestriensis]|uniref:histidine kinase n=1 Tax=Motilimonas cestriensis TaxID=2742685 RepID=A0ABS8W3Y8_9GAMM|nr:response regulator [Motilimonas cestriensis]MCE2593671.1 response regulator [Motilimonas cestriensis]
MLDIVADIRFRYRWALLAIAILISGSGLLIQHLISVQQADTKVINIAGKQRMLSQKIALHGHALLVSNAEHQLQHLKMLKQALSQFLSGHEFITQKNEQGQYLLLDSELQEYYFAMPAGLDATTRDYLASANQLVAELQLPRAVNFVDVDMSEFEVEEVERLLRQLDGAVTLFEQQAVAKVNLVSKIEYGFWFLALTLLLVELKFIFAPMEQTIADSLSRYKEQKNRAEQISQGKDRFIARVSHEFRTPLQGLITAIDTLTLADEQQAVKTQAHYCVNRLVVMLDELRDFHQLSIGQWQLNPTKANLQHTLVSVIAPFEFACQEKILSFEVHLDPALDCSAEFDHPRLQQVMMALLTNALKYTNQGSIKISLSLSEQQLHIHVSDTGVGFQQVYPYIEQEKHLEDNHFQGLQTGLARVQYIVAAQNGIVKFSDVQPHGAAVNISLPIQIDPSELKPKTGKVIKHVLIVEDDKVNAMILEQLLKSLNITSQWAENGLVAIELVKHQAFDVIFMDLNMPVMDGFQAIDIIRRDLNISTPIVVVTANIANSTLTRIYQLGANSHFYKPISMQSIEDVLNTLPSDGVSN